MRWVAKSAVQNTISLLPRGRELNGLLQRHVTRSVVLTPEKVVSKLARVGGRHLHHHAQFAGQPIDETRVVEVGTGFVPLLPVGLCLAGAAAVHTFDIVELASRGQTAALLRHLVAAADEGLLGRACPWVRPRRLTRLRELAANPPGSSLDELLAEMHITYTVGGATASGLEPGSADFFVTNNVLEHVPRQEIRALLAEAHRVGSRGAVVSHHIDLRDHYARIDPKIGVYNSLRFTSRQWRILNSRLEPQNRLRHSDYLVLVDEGGFDLRVDDAQDGSDREFFAVLPAPEFRRYGDDDLRVVDIWLAARRRDAA